MYSAGITGTGSYVPEDVLTNADLEKMVETNDEWIVSRTGIRERRIASKETTTSELCYHAALRALDAAAVAPEEVDLVIVPTVTPDYPFPATACLVAERIGAKKAAAFDLEAGCSGFIYGLAVASQFIATGMYKTVLVIGAETLSKVVNWQDRSTCILFGDGAGAAVIQRVEDGYGFLNFELGADGSGGDLLILPGGGSRYPADAESVAKKMHSISMAGNEVFKFAVRIMDEVTNNVLRNTGLTIDEVDLLVPHQANIRIVDSAVKRLKIPAEKVVVNLDRYGNMSAASIPVALDDAVKAGRVNYGDTLVLVGFGAGLTWGGAVLKWAGRGGKE